MTLEDGSFWVYEYDSLGQVKSGKRYWSDWTPVPGQQFEYGFDEIGNRSSTKAGGDENGTGLRSASYSANTLNQITQRDVPGAVDVLGAARGTVDVNSDSSNVYRRGEYFRKELAVNNSPTALWQSISVTATDGTTTNQAGNTFLPQTPEMFSYDLDGNQTNDGRWAYVWDAENRLLSMTSPSTAPSGSRKALHFGYDSKSRRISKVVSNWTGSAWVRGLDEKFLYDGWNLVAVFNGTNNALLKSFTWGIDLSGNMQGAGGIGGLISMTVHSGPNACTYFYAYDGNGNVAALINAADGSVPAQYAYSPFGELFRASGPLATVNPFRFSTKYQDEESELLYYGYRYYITSIGRWPNRDPLGEPGFGVARVEGTAGQSDGPNLYAFVRNDPTDRHDAYGLASRQECSFYDGLAQSPNACDRAYSSFGSFFCRAFGESDWEQCVRGCLMKNYSTGGEDCSSPSSTARFAAKVQGQHNKCYAFCACKVYGPRFPRLPKIPPFPIPHL